MLTRLRAALRRVARDEAGNTLVLYPFALLIVLGFGSLALDAAVFFQAHREAVDVAAGLASDMAAAIDERAFAVRDEIAIDLDRADDLLRRTNDDLAGHPNDLRCNAALGVTADQVVVRCRGTAEPLIGLGPFGSFELVGEAVASASAR